MASSTVPREFLDSLGLRPSELPWESDSIVDNLLVDWMLLAFGCKMDCDLLCEDAGPDFCFSPFSSIFMKSWIKSISAFNLSGYIYL